VRSKKRRALADENDGTGGDHTGTAAAKKKGAKTPARESRAPTFAFTDVEGVDFDSVLGGDVVANPPVDVLEPFIGLPGTRRWLLPSLL